MTSCWLTNCCYTNLRTSSLVYLFRKTVFFVLACWMDMNGWIWSWIWPRPKSLLISENIYRYHPIWCYVGKHLTRWMVGFCNKKRHSLHRKPVCVLLYHLYSFLMKLKLAPVSEGNLAKGKWEHSLWLWDPWIINQKQAPLFLECLWASPEC